MAVHSSDICTDVVHAVVMILLFSIPTHIPHAVALSLLVRLSSPLQPPIRSMLLANHRLQMGVPPMVMDVWWSCSISCLIFSRNKLNRMGESEHHWDTVVLKNSTSCLFKRTALLEFSYSAWIAWTSPLSMLKFLRTCHKTAWKSLSNAVVCSREKNYLFFVSQVSGLVKNFNSGIFSETVNINFAG